MKLGVLFSGGKDSTYSAYLAQKMGNELICLISIFSENKESYMFHTPGIELTKKQAKLMNLPIEISFTKGEKEEELKDLEVAIKKAVEKYSIDGIVTGALASVYQASRIQKICDKLKIKCINPLWKKDQINLLNELIENSFEVLVIGVFAYPLDKSWIGRKVDKGFIRDISELSLKYKINPAGEGGEIETLVVNCPLFQNKLNVKIKQVSGEKNSWRAEF